MSSNDLLTPTLTEADDASGFDRPWRPWSLVFAAFFIGPFGAAVLFAWNERRLGRPERMKLPIVTFVALGLALAAAATYLVDYHEEFVTEWKRVIRHGRTAITVLVAMLIARTQTRRFGVFDMSSSEEPAPLFAWGLALFVLSIVVEFALLFVFAMLFAVVLG